MTSSPTSLHEKCRQELATALAEWVPGLRFAYLFGSAADGRLTKQSDVDIAVDAGRRLKTSELLRISGHLESTAKRPVDLVDLQNAGPVLRMQVLKSGQLLSSRDDRARAEFAMYTPSLYEDWKHLRRPIDEALLERLRS